MKQYNSSIAKHNAIATYFAEENHNMIFVGCAYIANKFTLNCNVIATSKMRGTAC